MIGQKTADKPTSGYYRGMDVMTRREYITCLVCGRVTWGTNDPRGAEHAGGTQPCPLVQTSVQTDT